MLGRQSRHGMVLRPKKVNQLLTVTSEFDSLMQNTDESTNIYVENAKERVKALSSDQIREELEFRVGRANGIVR